MNDTLRTAIAQLPIAIAGSAVMSPRVRMTAGDVSGEVGIASGVDLNVRG